MAKQKHSHIFTTTIVTVLTLLVWSPTNTNCQQPYIREYGTDCDKHPKDTSALGYLCNGLNLSCLSFLTYRSRPPYTAVRSIAGLLSANPELVAEANSVAENATFSENEVVVVPVKCSCGTSRGEFYQYDAVYVAQPDDNYFSLANVTFQGLTTCQAIDNQTGNPPILNLETDDRVTIPLRCACPTKDQIDIGINYLLSYITDWDDDDFTISKAYGVNNALFLKANRLSELDLTIYPDTTVMIPLKSFPPNSSQSIQPPTSLPPPRSLPLVPSPPPHSSSKTTVYAIVGSIGGSVFLLVLICIVLFFYRFRKSKVLTSSKPDDSVLLTKSMSQENSKKQVLEQVIVSDMAGSLKVYDFEELKLATSGFTPISLIEGSVYRGNINGHLVAIKKMEGYVTEEINLLQKINHSNVVGLVGVCYDGTHWYIVYDYISNGSLSDWLFKNDNNDSHFLTWMQRIQIALDVATGLNYLHNFANPSHVHKDLKSSNILLDSDFKAKIANFGLTRSIRAQEGEFSVTNNIVGTIGYLGPEYLENGLVSVKLDVYAFGVVLLELITGKEVSVLYQETRTLSNLFSGLISDKGEEKDFWGFVDVSLREKCPDKLVVFVVRIIDGCLKKNPENRPTMDEIVQFLSRALSYLLTWEMSNGLVGVEKCFDGEL